ncbi:MAG: LysR family transcriptional regulator [Pseudomonadota bacterium]
MTRSPEQPPDPTPPTRLLRIRDLEYLLAVAEHRSFARAAVGLGVSQPTLSNQIRKIEDMVGRRLFQRAGRSVTLTPEAGALVEHAMRVTEAFYDFERASRGAGAFLPGPLRFGVIPTISAYLGAPLLAALREESDGAPVMFQEALTEEVEARVEAAELDFGVTATLPRRTELRARRIATERLAYVSARSVGDDPFSVEPGQPPRRPILLMHNGHCFREAVFSCITRVNGAAADAADLTASPATLSTLISLAASGLGDAVIPAPFMATLRSQAPTLNISLLDRNPFQRSIHLIYRASREKQSGLTKIERIARETHRRVAAVS